MTVCIAALCQESGEPRAVVAADRMVTLGGFIEWEHTIPKMTHASSYSITMVAGETLIGTKIARDVAAAFGGGEPPLAEVARALAIAYETARRERVEQQLLSPRGLTFATFYASHQQLNPNIVAMLDQQMQQFNLGVELLLAGVDTTGAHIYAVAHPGPPENLHDPIGYAAVGSGTIHALQAFIGFGHSAEAEYHETVFRAYAAKRRSEVAPGVGLDTDMAVISSGGTHWLTEEELVSCGRSTRSSKRPPAGSYKGGSPASNWEKECIMRPMAPSKDEAAALEQPATGLAWPTVDPDLAVSLLLQEAALLTLQTQIAHPPVIDEPVVRDLSPLGR